MPAGREELTRRLLWAIVDSSPVRETPVPDRTKMEINDHSRVRIYLSLGVALIIFALGDKGASELIFERVTPRCVEARYEYPGWHGLFPWTEFEVASVSVAYVEPKMNKIWITGSDYDDYEINAGGTPQNGALIDKFFKTSASGQTLRIPIFRLPLVSLASAVCAVFLFIAAYRRHRGSRKTCECSAAPAGEQLH
jgi:hypothetical protein